MGVEVKGSAITARVRWVREHHGEAALKELKRRLEPEHRAALERRILPHEWVPFELMIAVSTELDRQHGRGDLELCRTLGAYAAKVNLPTLYRIFYTVSSPAFIVRRAARVWDVHYSSGRLEAETSKERDGTELARLRIVGFETPHRAHCLSVLGWSEQSVELSGGKLVGRAEEVACRTTGSPCCELVVRWR